MGRWMNQLCETVHEKHHPIVTGCEPARPAKPDRQQYQPVETITPGELWDRLQGETIDGAYLLNTESDYKYTWGAEVLVADRGRYVKLRQQYPAAMILDPADFRQIISDWPESEGLLLALKTFGGELMPVIKITEA